MEAECTTTPPPTSTALDDEQEGILDTEQKGEQQAGTLRRIINEYFISHKFKLFIMQLRTS
jgi:hypothetical protein